MKKMCCLIIPLLMLLSSCKAQVVYKTDKAGIMLECIVAWESSYIDDISDVLHAENTPCVFVVGGEYAIKHTDTIQKIHENGQAIATFGMNYDDTDNSDEDELQKSIAKSCDIIESITGEKPIYYFCPFSCTAKAKRAAKKCSLACVRSTTELLCARGNEDDIKNQVHKTAADGAIVAFTPTVQLSHCLKEVIEIYRDMGYNIIGGEAFSIKYT